MRRSVLIMSSCFALAGCSAQLYGNQSATGATTSSAVVASTRLAGAQASFSSGAPVPAGAPGGQVAVGRGAGVVLLVGAIVVDAVGFLVSSFTEPRLRPAQEPMLIMDTCSCFGYKPALADR